MLTTDKTITTSEYWDSLYRGERNDKPVDSSNGIRPPKSFDRFDIVVKHAEGPNVLGVGSGHAHIEKRIKALHPEWFVVASDQSLEAQKVSNYKPYILATAYKLLLSKTYKWNTVIATQMIEYLEFPDEFMNEVKRVGNKFLCTVPKNEMKKWSQLRIYTEENFKQWLSMYGEIEVFEDYEELMLAKIKFT